MDARAALVALFGTASLIGLCVAATVYWWVGAILAIFGVITVAVCLYYWALDEFL